MGKRIIFTVTNDLSYDQRMIRICTSLAKAGFEVLLVGRSAKNSIPLIHQPFLQKRLNPLFQKGKLFYVSFNIQLFFYLLFKKTHAICAIDLDTILPCFIISKIKNAVRIYDAHELFCEMKEIVTRPAIYSVWKYIERITVPKFSNGYTVNTMIAQEFNKMYGVAYETIRNISSLENFNPIIKNEKFILYQGAVNEGRGFEILIPAMQFVNVPLLIYGDGNFLDQSKELVKRHNLDHKIFFKGKLPPIELKMVTRTASIGITIFEEQGMSNIYSLANRYFDYLHAGVPQLCVDFPAYRELNNLYEVAVLLTSPDADKIALELNNLLNNDIRYNELVKNCERARLILNWQEEEIKLIKFYKKIMF